jgi:hypothetical protein
MDAWAIVPSVMVQATDPTTISVPRILLAEIANVSDDQIDRMHELLEKNTDGKLTPIEKTELEALVGIAELAQFASMALESPSRP